VGPLVTVTVGGVRSIVQVMLALPTLPAASVACAVNVCAPATSPAKAFGDVHAANAPASSLHVSVPSVVVNAKVAVVAFVGFVGPLVIVTTGLTVSTENARVALPVLPAASVTRTSNTCAPSASATVVAGDVHVVNVPVSTRHAVAMGEPAVVNVKLGVVTLVAPVGPPVIVTVGATVSVVHVNVAAAPWLPNGSVARTRNVWAPSLTAGPVNGDVHAANVTTPSIWHSNVAVASVDENANVGVLSLVGSVGCASIVTGGGVASTVHARFAGDGSTKP